MTVGIPKETYPSERRIALVPAALPALTKQGLDVLVETDAGTAAGFPDEAFVEKGARVAQSRRELFDSSDIVLQVRGPGANPEHGRADLDLLRNDQVLIGFQEPLTAPALVAEMANRRVIAFSMELMPRTTRAQSMDALSSMATIAGYKAVLLAAEKLPRMFPMLMTAAGTVTPARVFVIGAGVAGLQAIATARRLGAIVHAYDLRPVVKEQVQSLGGRFVELPLEAADAQDAGGYAKAQDEGFYRRQREMMAKVVAESDVVIATAAVPGQKAPVLITRDMVHAMPPGSIIVDLAAERGGNCELTQPDQILVANGVTVLGPTNLASTVPYHASQMYARNVSTFLLHLVHDGKVRTDGENDEIVRDTLLTRGGNVVHARIRELIQ